MKRTAGVLLLFIAPSCLHAQVTTDRALTRGAWLLTAELGGSAFTDFHRMRATAPRASGGTVPVERRVSASTSATLGARLGYWAGRSWGLRAGLTWSPSHFTVVHDAGGDATLETFATADSTVAWASLVVWGGDVALLFQFPRSLGRVQPYGLVGGGFVRYRHGDDAALPAEAREPFADGERSSASAVIGFGAFVPLQRNDLMLSFELTDHLSRSPLANSRATDGLMSLEPEPGSGITNHLRLVVGLTLPIR